MTSRHGKNQERKHSSPSSILGTEGIKVGNISGGTGFAIGHGAESTVTQMSGLTANEIEGLFSILQQKVSALPDGPDKSIAQNAVQALQAEALKGENATETQVQKWMKFLADTAPDAWEVALDMFTNPIKGIGTVFKKIADKAKSKEVGKNARV